MPSTRTPWRMTQELEQLAGSGMDSESAIVSERLTRLGTNRKVVLYAHCVLGLVSGLVYLGTQDLRHFAYWARGAGTMSIVWALPALLPYILSLLFSYRLVNHLRIRTWLFIAVLASGAAVSIALRLRPSPDTPYYVVAFVQTFVYLFAGGLFS